MKCRYCGNEQPDQLNYCVRCGKKLEVADYGRSAGKRDFPTPVTRAAETMDNGQAKGTNNNPLMAVLIGLLCAVAILLLVIMVSNSHNNRKENNLYGENVIEQKDADDDDSDLRTETQDDDTSETEEETSDSEMKEDDITESEYSQPSTPVPVPSETEISEVKSFVGNYLNAFVQDLNEEQYNRLYYYIEPGSTMETNLLDFFPKAAALDQQEQLLGYEVNSVNKISDTKYHVTTTESYEVFQNEKPFHWWIRQQCTYEMIVQGNGSLKIASYVGNIVALDKGEYE